MHYTVIKFVHMGCVALTLFLFVLRGALVVATNARLESRLLVVVPQVVDTVLLASAIALSVMLQQYPLVDPWLTAKVVGLVVYIGLGLVVMRFATRRSQRFVAFIGALAAFGYILAVAVTKRPFPFG